MASDMPTSVPSDPDVPRAAWTVQVMSDQGPTSAALAPSDLEQPASLTLRSLPGSTGIWLPILRNGHPTIVAEIPVHEDEETVRVTLHVDLYGKPYVSVANRPVYCIQADHKFSPAEARQAAADSDHLDIVLLVDGTTRSWTDRGFEPLINGPNWQAHTKDLGELVEAVAGGFERARYGIVAFGDHGSDRLKARDLTPSYALKPDQPSFEVFLQAKKRDVMAPVRGLHQLSPTSGGDYVDALAYALVRIASMPWTDTARKLLVISGDSPGRALLAPTPHPSDNTRRSHDVDAARLLLHNSGVEVVTMYHAPAEESGLLEGELERDLCQHSLAQYRRLATRPQFFIPDAANFSPSDLADQILANTGWYGRGPCLAALQS